MSESIISEEHETKTLTAYWSSAYFFAVAVLYLWGYWSPFKVNILEYVSLSDVVKTSAYPIASVFIFMVLGALMGEVMFPHGFLPKGSGITKKVGHSLHRIAPHILIFYLVGISLYAIFGSVYKWNYLPVLFAIPVTGTLKELGVLKSFLKSDGSRTFVLFLLAVLPPMAYGRGAIEANDIISGKTYTYVISEVTGHSFDPRSEAYAHLRYVGKAGDQYFLYAPETKSVLILSKSDATLLELKTVEVNVRTESGLPTSKPASGIHNLESGKK
ncbi:MULTISPECIES: hypothetical protein [Pseudomonas]|uniref:Uncharacterized protein n=1 Tax=Pseudomonas putida TaxID=303 RepID=A0A1L7N761_PSEPU|nr:MULTISPECIES: hypothetical protein [Pseudomonas]KAF0251372.1 hypothetical protein GN299_28725 [Pseudomonas putida]WQE54858.1 hypothetical protein U0028_04025 [Pseudomonas putida]BAW21302.1 Uncharacterized protein KF715C_ch7290 [Pseudomonas putida]GLO04634.1 hypothetical protein PPUJ13061_45360 [Pseudomonas putida]HDS1007239.1 hypothetical protein [Pseudomonas putida]